MNHDRDACLDAETLAAWADRALDARERAGVEAHAADCARCQAMLAAMVKTMPAPARSPWRFPTLGWLVPLTVAATALVIWIAVPRPAPRQVSDGGAPAVDLPTPAARPATPAAGETATRQADVTPEGQIAQAQAPFAPAEAPAARRERQDEDALKKKAAAASAPSATALSDTANIPPTALPPPSAAPAGAPASLAAPAARRALANRLEVVVVSSNPSTRFRLLPGGGVQRSADGGATWRNEVVPTTDPLTAGASPSPSVCWLVGPSGTVLLSTDGRSWRRLAFPETADLRGVAATDSDSATVTAVDGRAFVTTDGGQTWSRAPDP